MSLKFEGSVWWIGLLTSTQAILYMVLTIIVIVVLSGIFGLNCLGTEQGQKIRESTQLLLRGHK